VAETKLLDSIKMRLLTNEKNLECCPENATRKVDVEKHPATVFRMQQDAFGNCT
jgi:hypothetical protein